jgi:hypothetical protein
LLIAERADQRPGNEKPAGDPKKSSRILQGRASTVDPILNVGIGSGTGGLHLPHDRCDSQRTTWRYAAMKSKVAVLLAGGLVALMLLSRYFVLRRAGMPLEWLLYLGLPITAAGVLFALGLVNLGKGWSTKIDAPRQSSQAQARPRMSLSARLKELEELHTRGAISATEYSARRLQIIAACSSGQCG